MKYYKVIKENFLWEVGAIITDKDENNRYLPVDPIFYKDEKFTEYISGHVVENSPEYLERVYPVNLLTKTVYRGFEEAKQLLAREYTE